MNEEKEKECYLCWAAGNPAEARKCDHFELPNKCTSGEGKECLCGQVTQAARKKVGMTTHNVFENEKNIKLAENIGKNIGEIVKMIIEPVNMLINKGFKKLREEASKYE